MSGEPLIVTGFPRAGTTLLYCMLRYAAVGYVFGERESLAMRAGIASKSPRAVFETPGKTAHRCIVMLRDPRYLLTSQHPADKFRGRGYFVSAHSCLNDRAHGICEWWAAIRRLSGAHLVRYEELIAAPRAVQEDLAHSLGLRYKADRHFDEFYKEPHGECWETAMHGRRTLCARTRYDHERVQSEFEAYPELYDVTREMGYP